MPFAGYRVARVYDVGCRTSLWSSSPNDMYPSNFGLYSSNVSGDVSAAYNGGRRDGNSVRCFKDSALDFPSAASQVAFWTGEVAGKPACSGEVLS